MYFKAIVMPITIRLGDDVEKRLDALAKTTGPTKTYYIRQALEEKLEEMEDIYIAQSRLEQPGGKRWSLEELERGDDLEG
jgi:RHH-type rel operon transcriptional repressor/antitoxin RelB